MKKDALGCIEKNNIKDLLMTNEKPPVFSIIIPTWNRIDPLVRAVKSVISQSFSDWEVFVIDDGSTNQNEVIDAISRLNDKRIHIIGLENNHNASYARNIGITKSSGSWVCFLDSDDSFSPDKLLAIHNKISKENKKISEKTIIYSQISFHSNFGHKSSPLRALKENEKISDYLFISNNLIGTSTLVLSRKFVIDLKFDSRCIKHQDYDLLLRAEEAGANFYFIDKVLGVREYRTAGNNIGTIHIPDYSYKWYINRKKMFSKYSSIGFMYTHIFDSMVQKGKKQSILDIIKIIKNNNLSLNHFFLLLTTLLPYTCFQYIRNRKIHPSHIKTL